MVDLLCRYVYNNHAVSPTAETPKWILALGGVGLVCGLATYGYNIIKVSQACTTVDRIQYHLT
jgi:phosphate/sulfate permease